MHRGASRGEGSCARHRQEYAQVRKIQGVSPDCQDARRESQPGGFSYTSVRRRPILSR